MPLLLHSTLASEWYPSLTESVESSLVPVPSHQNKMRDTPGPIRGSDSTELPSNLGEIVQPTRRVVNVGAKETVTVALKWSM